MSLKAKIEAVIYASEEPVTLAQLMGLLGEEAQAEIEAAASRQGSLSLDEDGAAGVTGEDAQDDDAASGQVATFAEEPAARDVTAEVVAESTAKIGAPEEAPVDASPGDAEPVAADEKEAAKDAKAREKALREHFRLLLDALIADYANGDRGLEVREVAGGFRLATKPEYHDAVRGFVKGLKPPLKLSLQALETLAVVAYKQPVTAPEVSEIRGVDSGGVLGGLLTRKLVTTAGRKQVIGRPILYKTTKDFLLRFGLKDINELPSIEEFEKMAGELVDAEPMQEEIPMGVVAEKYEAEEKLVGEDASAFDDFEPKDAVGTDGAAKDAASTEANADVEPMRDVHEAQADGVPDEEAASGDAAENGTGA